MLYTGFYIILALITIKKLSNFTTINLGILVGIIIPDLGIFFKYIGIFPHSHGSFFHSIIFIISLFLLLLIINEIKSKTIGSKMINGIFIGLLIHVFFDIIFSGGNILFFWPLPLPSINSLITLEINNQLLYIIAAIQFLALRYFGYIINNGMINTIFLNSNKYRYITIISYWMNYQFLIFFLFLILLLFNIKFSEFLMDLSIFTSLLIALFFLYNIKGSYYRGNIIGE